MNNIVNLRKKWKVGNKYGYFKNMFNISKINL